MPLTEFRTDDVPRADRFGLWYDAAMRGMLPSVLTSAHRDDFRGSTRRLDLGPVQVSTVRHPGLESLRTGRLARRTEAGYLQLVVSLSGGHRAVLARQDALLGPGEMMLFDGSEGWRVLCHTDRPPVRAVLVTFRQDSLPFPASRIAGVAGRRLPGHEGLGALMTGHLTTLMAGAAHYRPADTGRLAGLTLDHLATWCGHVLETTGDVPAESRRRVLQEQLRAFIEHHLHDPGLTPATIAEAHHISVRYLHQLFQEQGMTVAASIRRRRLERCHRDLADPRLSACPVQGIAARWGFRDPARFSRLFRDTYGMTPTEHRRAALTP
ncbi:helix-turn-helix domain-containing protein [Streptomyces specialis]|uniref:helix-turn-helix domain-containing protein n=1 Tax=Streptomyces specialis TaxID=498367 RepID=UPI00073E32C4|nr:helix-turn-helix domain-containing protein [Streptomyces specialis]